MRAGQEDQNIETIMKIVWDVDVILHCILFVTVKKSTTMKLIVFVMIPVCCKIN